MTARAASLRGLLGATAVGLALALGAVSVGAQSADAIALTIGEGGSLTLFLPPGTVVETGDPRELLLRLPGPVDEPAVRALAGRLADRIDGVSTGYDSVLFVFRAPVRVTPGPGTVRVEPAPPGAAADAAADGRAARRLAILDAQLRLRDDDARGARDALRTLTADDPADVDAALALAEAESGLGRWRAATAIYDRVLTTAPEREEVRDARTALRRAFGPQARVETGRVTARDADTQTVTLATARTGLVDDLELDVAAERRRLRIDALRRPDGRLEGTDVLRTRLDLGLSRRLDGGEKLSARLLAGPRRVGFGTGWATPALGGTTEATAEVGRPFWDVAGALADGGRVDRVGVLHTRTLGQRWSLVGGLRASRYGIADQADVARGVGVTGSARRLLWPSPTDGAAWPTLSVGYVLDAEYMLRTVERDAPDGARFRPIDLTTREIHGLEIAGGWAIGTPVEPGAEGRARLDLAVGFAKDRFGGQGPTAAFGFSTIALPGVELGVRSSYSAVSARGRDGATQRFDAFLSVGF